MEDGDGDAGPQARNQGGGVSSQRTGREGEGKGDEINVAGVTREEASDDERTADATARKRKLDKRLGGFPVTE